MNHQKRIYITEDKLNVLKEYYQAPLYHFTDLYSACQILESGYIRKYGDQEGKYDNRVDCKVFTSLSRSKSFYEGYQEQILNAVRFEFDPTSVMNNIRKSKILPFSATESPSMSEFEERFYNENNQLMLDKNLKSITIKIGNISHLDYRTEYYRYDYDCEDLSDKDLNRMLIDDIVNMAIKKYGIKVEFKQ